MNHDRVTKEGQETAALYALGALSQHEARMFDLHLNEGCEACSAELKQFDRVVDVLGSEAEPVSPPAYLRDLLAVRIEKEAPDRPPVSGSVLAFPEKAAVLQNQTEPASSSPSRVILPWAAAAILLIGLAYTFVSWRSERQTMRAALEQEKAHSDETLDENDRLKEQIAKETDLATELAQINAVLSSPQWRVIPLTGLDPAPASAAKVYWDVQKSRWVVTADLPPAPAGKVYQLWFVTASAKVSAGLIKPDKTGHGFAILQFPSQVTQLQAAAITLEPEGGSEQPTMPIYALGKVS